MSEPTKRPLIDDSHLLVVSCPAVNVDSVMNMLKQNGCAVNDATPDEDEEVIAYIPPPPDKAPGLHLQGLRYRENMTQEQLARRVGIPRRHISEMENNRRPIGEENANKLAEAFNIDPRLFL